MARLMAKLGFVHRTLWQREPAYRWAFLLGTPPLVGCALAALFWAGAQHVLAHAPLAMPGAAAPWAHWTRPVVQDGQPFSETPSATLPPEDATGGYVGFQPGWVGGIHPITIDAALDVNVLPASLGSFTLDQPEISLARVLDAGPPTGLFVGAERALFVVRTGGVYAFSARLTRDGTQSADCLVRLGSAHHRILRNIVLNTDARAVLDFPATSFQLTPGLYFLAFAVGCWRGDQMADAGELTLMVRRPGDAAMTEATADEVIRPASR